MNKPLALVALAYLAGIVAGELFPIPVALPLILAASAVLMALFIPQTRLSLIVLGIFLSGWANLLLHTSILSPADLRVLVEDQSEWVGVRGKMRTPPAARRYENRGEEVWRSTAEVEVFELRRGATWEPASGKILASANGLLGENLSIGCEVEITGALQKPRLPVAEGLFNYRQFLSRQGIYYQLTGASVGDWKLLKASSTSPPFPMRFTRWARSALGLGLGKTDEALQLRWAMTLGWKEAFTDELSEPFMRSGTMHIFAISGLHIALIAGILVQLLKLTGLPRAVCGLTVIPLLWFYAAATGWQSSAIRATIMMTVIVGGWALKRPGDLLNSLGAAALMILVWEPLQLFQASFQLSFFVVLSMGLLLPVFEKIRQRLFRPDPFLPEELRKPWQRFFDSPTRWLGASFATSLAAWLGSLPLIAYYFNLFTPVSLLANVVVVLLGTLALMSSVGSLAAGAVWPGMGALFNHSGWFFMNGAIETSRWFADLPGAFWYVRSPTMLQCIFYYGVVFSILTGWVWKAKIRLWVGPLLAVLGFMTIMEWNHRRSVWQITVLPLNGGEAALVSGPKLSDTLLIDCGNPSSFHFITKPFLRSQGVNALPRLLLTHGDMQNIGGATNLLDDFKVEKILTSPAKFRSPAYRSIQKQLEDTPEMREEIKQGDQLGPWQVLHPALHDKFNQADDGPVVLRGTFGIHTLLLLSDLSRTGQRQLLERTTNLTADIVVSGIPRESEPLIDDLLDAVSPKLIIITDSEFPATERASSALCGRLAKRKVPVLYCRKSGAVTLTFGPDGATATTIERQIRIE